jgi:amino acid transporter
LGVWALCTIVTTSVVVPTIVTGAGTTLNAAGIVTEKTAGALGAAGGVATQAGQNLPSGAATQVQQLLGTNVGEADPVAVQSVTRLIGQRITQGNWTPQQRDELVNSVAGIAKISPDDARRRVEEAQNTLTAALEQAQQSLRQAADAARTAVAAASYWAFAAMLIGAIAALLGARFGLLDETHLPGFARLGSSRPRETHA